jgi:hypothetical protein
MHATNIPTVQGTNPRRWDDIVMLHDALVALPIVVSQPEIQSSILYWEPLKMVKLCSGGPVLGDNASADRTGNSRASSQPHGPCIVSLVAASIILVKLIEVPLFEIPRNSRALNALGQHNLSGNTVRRCSHTDLLRIRARRGICSRQSLKS